MSSTDSSSSPPSVKEDQPLPEIKQKLESDNNKDRKVNVFYFNDESSWRLFEDYGDNDDYDLVDDEDESDDEREITDEELQQYKAAFEASDGFDVPSFPGVFCCCLVTPVVLDAYTRETLNPLCVAAMDHYNYEKKTDYQFLKLEKANAQGARGLLYYLTFVGRTLKDNTTQIFEARVLWGIPENEGDDPTEVYFCRKKVPSATTDFMKAMQLGERR